MDSQKQADPQEQANQQEQADPQKQVDPHVQFERYVCAVLAPIFCTSKEVRTTYLNEWKTFSTYLEKKAWQQECENSVFHDLQDEQMLFGDITFNILDPYFASKLISNMNESGFQYLFWLFCYESTFTGILTAPLPSSHLSTVYTLFSAYFPKTRELNISPDCKNYNVSYRKTFVGYLEEFMSIYGNAFDNSTEESSTSEEEDDDIKPYGEYLFSELSKDADLCKKFDTAYNKFAKSLASICSDQMGLDTFLRYRHYLNAGWRPYIGDDAVL